MDYKAEAHAMQDQLVKWRRDLHMHPELGLQEQRTSSIVADYLTRLGYRVYVGIAETGVIGIMEGVRPGPAVMLRFDMDALPIQEENQVDYASQTPGVMHACGHDGHVTIGLGTATLLQRHRHEWAGTVKFVFQPAEEGMNGAERMVDAGALDDYGPRPDVAFGLHIWNRSALGQAGVTPGPMMAAADHWALTVTGRGGHGAIPHQTADPIVAAAQIINALQTVISRNVDPQKTAVLTVGTINGGTAFNIIPGQVELTGTIRTFDAEVRAMVLSRFEALCQGIATGMGVEADLQVRVLTPAVVNDPAAAALMRRAAESILGKENVFTEFRTMGSEDMAYFMQEVPGSFMFLGSANAARGLDFPHHSSRFDFDEGALALGVAILAETTTQFLNQPAKAMAQAPPGQPSNTDPSI
jgi:amidohydrolase